MSKRFGRNQKRALRLANNELAEMVAKGKDREAYLMRAMEENQRTVEMTAAVLGRDFATLPPRDHHVGHIPNPCLIPEVRRMPAWPPEENAAEYVSHQLIMLTESEGARYDSLIRNVHFRFVTPAGHIAYGMSEDAYRNMPDAWFMEHLPREITQAVAEEIIKIRNKGGLRGR